MTRFRVVFTSTGWFSNVPQGASLDVWSSSDVKPSHDEVRQAFIDKYGKEPSGSAEWTYQAY